MTTQKAKIAIINTGFSECLDFQDRVFNSAHEFDLAIMTNPSVMAQEIDDLSYYKTEVTVTWEDGETHGMRLDINRGENLSTHFQSLYYTYCVSILNRDRAGDTRYIQAREHYKKFFATHSI